MCNRRPLCQFVDFLIEKKKMKLKGRLSKNNIYFVLILQSIYWRVLVHTSVFLSSSHTSSSSNWEDPHIFAQAIREIITVFWLGKPKFKADLLTWLLIKSNPNAHKLDEKWMAVKQKGTENMIPHRIVEKIWN